MKVIILEKRLFGGKKETHEYIAEALGFPSYYGNNLDALADCLSELPRDVGVILSTAGSADVTVGAFEEVFSEILGRRFFTI